MTDERIKELVFTPMNEAWHVIRLTQNLSADNTEGWEAYIKAHDDFCKKYDHDIYGYHLAMAIMAIVDEIAKENNAS